MRYDPTLPAAGEDSLFELEPWLQEWVDRLRSDHRDKHFYQRPLAEVQMAMVTFAVFGEKLLEPGASLEETMKSLMDLWRAGYAQFGSDPKTGGTKLFFPGDKGFKKTSRAHRRAQHSEARRNRNRLVNRIKGRAN